MHAIPARLLVLASILALLASGSQAASTHHHRALPVHEHQKAYSFLPDRKPAAALLLPQAHPAGFIRPTANLSKPEGSATHTQPEIHISPAYSWIDAFPPEEINQLATLLTKQIESRLPLSQAILLISPPATPSAKSFHANLTDRLRKKGFTLATHPADGVTPVRYRISRADFNILLRLRIRNTDITRLYEHSVFGHYVAVSPICVIDRGEE